MHGFVPGAEGETGRIDAYAELNQVRAEYEAARRELAAAGTGSINEQDAVPGAQPQTGGSGAVAEDEEGYVLVNPQGEGPQTGGSDAVAAAEEEVYVDMKPQSGGSDAVAAEHGENLYDLPPDAREEA